MRVSGIAAQLTSTIGRSARGLARCISRASIPLPVPVSPRMNTGGGRRAADHRSSSRPARSRRARISGLSPSRSDSISTGYHAFLELGFRVLGLARLELADQPPVAPTDDLELVLGVPHRIAAAPVVVPDLDHAVVRPVEEPVSRPEADTTKIPVDCA